MSAQLEWENRKAQVKADLQALQDAGIPLDTARRLAGWNITLEYNNFADVTAWPPPAVTPSPDGLGDSLKLLFSRSAGRVNVGNLNEAVLDAGKEYAIFVPNVVELFILKIDFSLNGVHQHSEFSAPWDYAGTAVDGSANRVTFIAGDYTISATAATPHSPINFDATFSVE